MARSLVERRLIETSKRLKQLRADLAVVDEQLDHFRNEADEARLRALVSETALADREQRDAQKHLDAMVRHRAEVVAEVAKLEQQQDELLDRMGR
jgi:chromosome segregation ATPase